jgi:proteasome lid subunit RPN8/RPN11
VVSGLRLPAAVRAAMIDHARAEYPNESCGLLGGNPDGIATQFVPCRNTDASPTSYTLDPQDQISAINRFEDEGWELLAIFHSHPHTAAYPSPTDQRLAFYPDSLYVIASLADRERPELRAFFIREREVTEVPVSQEVAAPG